MNCQPLTLPDGIASIKFLSGQPILSKEHIRLYFSLPAPRPTMSEFAEQVNRAIAERAGK